MSELAADRPWGQPRCPRPVSHRRRQIKWIAALATVALETDWPLRLTAAMAQCLLHADAVVRRRHA